MPHNQIQSYDAHCSPEHPVPRRNPKNKTRRAANEPTAHFARPAFTKMHSFERLLLEALKNRLNAESVHLVYGVSMNMREISLSTCPDAHLVDVVSPYDWEGACLPRSYKLDDKYITESVFFDDKGSASWLRLAHDKEIADLPDQVIVEHCKLHAALEMSFHDGSRAFQLNNNESTALYWGARGLTAKETAKEMGLNYRSIEYLLKTAKEKLGAQSLPEAIHRAMCTRQLRK